MKSRGLIEAQGAQAASGAVTMFSAVKSRGLIEAAALQPYRCGSRPFSAVKSRGLIEAHDAVLPMQALIAVFRGEEPRPH